MVRTSLRYFIFAIPAVFAQLAGCRDQTLHHRLVVGCWESSDFQATIDDKGIMKVGDETFKTSDIRDNNHNYSLASEPFRIRGNTIKHSREGMQDAWVLVHGNSESVDMIKLIDTEAVASPDLHRCADARANVR